jgi:hypothetical protein
VSPLAPEQTALLAALARHGVDFVVLGGVAAQIHGWRTATLDLDIAVAIDAANVDRLNAALASVGAGTGMPGALGTAFSTRYGRLEIVRRADGIGDHGAWARRALLRDTGDGFAVLVAHPDDILRSKEAAGREKDAAALPQMRRDFLDAGALDARSVRGPVAGRAPSLRSASTDHAQALLGRRPDDPSQAAIWDAAAQLVADFRARWRVPPEEPGLGRAGSARDRERDRRAVEQALTRARRRVARQDR